MNRFFDYLYAKSKLKAQQDKTLVTITGLANKYVVEMHDLTRLNMELKKKNYMMQIFIEDNVSEDIKNKFFK